MRHRQLTRGGLEVSELGYGAWGIGQSMWLGAEDDESLRALARAFELGVDFVDTALGYGNGHSEELVGQAVRANGGGIAVSTKIPPKNMQWPARAGVHADEAFPADWIVECTERSLHNLALERIDLQQFHVWSDEWLEQGSWREAVERLQADGKIGAFGVSINDHQPSNGIALVESGAVESVQVIYNVFDQTPEDALFAATQANDVGVIVRVAFDEGALTGRIRPETTFPDGDWRNHYFRGERKREVWDRAQAIAADLEIEIDDLPEIALRFVLSHPAVTTVIAGMRSLANVDRNTTAAARGPLDEAQLAALHAHRWDRNFYA